MRATLILAASVLVTACATNPDRIDAAYVSPLKYQQYDCQQIAMEMDYVGQRTTKLYNRLKSESNADAWQMGVGLLLFWPSLFLLEGGDGADAAEYAQLKGEYEALRDNSVRKKCGIQSRSPEQIMKEYDDASRKKSANSGAQPSNKNRSEPEYQQQHSETESVSAEEAEYRRRNGL